MYSIIFRRQARRELDAAGDWYEKELAGLGSEFLDEIENSLRYISNNPKQFSILFRDARKAVVQRFPYCIYFRIRNQYIVVLAVFHSSRNPAEWRKRTK